MNQIRTPEGQKPSEQLEREQQLNARREIWEELERYVEMSRELPWGDKELKHQRQLVRQVAKRAGLPVRGVT